MKLSKRDKRALKVGAVCIVGILAFTFGTRWVGHWSQVRKSIANNEAKLHNVERDKALLKISMSRVPVFEDPNDEEEQKIFFRDKFHEQLKQSGFKFEQPIRVIRAKKAREGIPYKLMGLQTRGKCGFDQLLELFTKLYENPYLVGIDEMRMECDPKNRREFKLDLAVSTFVK
ncbi:MAG: hypothetical protein JSV16_09335 [Candidatus Hydrogenedentota bacterium]|nr:MAG: hypothetical protein JSV16_09335 [Candidatus Hydrogenedentota bacterium]